MNDKGRCPPESCAEVVSQQFLNIAWGLKDSLPYGPGFADLAKTRVAPPKKDEPITRCLPTGVMVRQTDPRFRKIIQTRGFLIILSEYNKSYRQIITDGRPLPVDPQPAFDSYSIGKWEGDRVAAISSSNSDWTFFA